MRISDWSSDVCSSDLFAAEPGGGRPFGARAIDRVPREWIAALPGDLLVGVHLELLAATAPEPDAAALQAVFGHDGINGSLVSGGAAVVWMDFRVQDDGFARVLLHDRPLRPRRAGRQVHDRKSTRRTNRN